MTLVADKTTAELEEARFGVILWMISSTSFGFVSRLSAR